MRTIRLYFQHKFNPLHVYCRLRQIGVHTSAALRVCIIYERFIFRVLRF